MVRITAGEHDDITAVIPCFEAGMHLAQAVESLSSQAGGPPRIIVVDDGSRDEGTQAALGGLPRHVGVLRQPNQGPAAARNAAIAASTTPLVLPLDADDRLAPGALRVLSAALRAEPQLGFAYGRMRFFGEWTGELRLPPYDPYGLLYRHTIGITALIRRELLEDVGGYDPSLPGYEDWELWLHALARGWRGRRVDATVLEYRREGHSLHLGARRNYRRAYRALRRKHAGLYSTGSRRRLARESELGPLGRAAYRFIWGPRPVPARLELALQRRLWRPR